jgi:hypothetical protein
MCDQLGACRSRSESRIRFSHPFQTLRSHISACSRRTIPSALAGRPCRPRLYSGVGGGRVCATGSGHVRHPCRRRSGGRHDRVGGRLARWLASQPHKPMGRLSVCLQGEMGYRAGDGPSSRCDPALVSSARTRAERVTIAGTREMSRCASR